MNDALQKCDMTKLSAKNLGKKRFAELAHRETARDVMMEDCSDCLTDNFDCQFDSVESSQPQLINPKEGSSLSIVVDGGPKCDQILPNFTTLCKILKVFGNLLMAK